MKFIEINVGKSINPNTGEEWWKASTKVSMEEGEVPEDVFKQLRDRLNSWLPNPVSQMADTFSKAIPQVKIDPMISRMRILIDGATSKKELDGYRTACPKEMLPDLEAKYKKVKNG